MNDSIWKKEVGIKKRETLAGDLSAEAIVIGGGMAGILTAYFLQECGVETVVLEGARIGSGQTGNTTAKITSQHALCYDRLIQDFGEEKAGLYAQANQDAIKAYKMLIKEKKIECQFEELPAYLYSLKDRESLEAEEEAAKKLGLPAKFVTETELPFKVKGAVCFEGQAQFHPLLFLEAIADEVTVFENTKVLDVEEDRVITDHGTVTGKYIIFATHYPFLNVPGFYFIRMHQERSYVTAYRDALPLHGMYYGIDEDGLSFRSSGELLLLGGGSHRTGENSAGGKYEFLRKKAEELFPDSKEEAHWSAQDCMPADHIPYIGRYSSSKPNWYAATGFQKWGMTSSMVAARILCDLITEKENPYIEVFSPERITFSESAKSVMKDSVQAVKGLTKRIFYMPETELEELPNGRGGVVEYEGEKVGVYKNEDGESFIVSTKCPHMGCQLEWNPDELSWDCSCHGSRFDYHGNLLDNPAQEDITYD